ncbi:MAG: hypothetical protein ACREXX_10855 [Gammaproteobacteria bacterium]
MTTTSRRVAPRQDVALLGEGAGETTPVVRLRPGRLEHRVALPDLPGLGPLLVILHALGAEDLLVLPLVGFRPFREREAVAVDVRRLTGLGKPE